MIRSHLLEAGAAAVGFAEAAEVERETLYLFSRWLEKGENAGMEYMHNYPDLRRDPRLLLEGTRTVISLAFSFAQPRLRPEENAYIAQYAYGKDYHKELRKALRPVIKTILEEKFGSRCRICIDSAPIMERYWAKKAGIGYIGDNGSLIVPGAGSMLFLVEILTTLPILPDKPLEQDCGHCGACRRSCPGLAINEDGTIDCRRCLSYLSIEHRGPFQPITNNQQPLTNNQQPTTPSPTTIFGCDRCLTVCPHNRKPAPIRIPSLLPSDRMMTITSDDILRMEPGDLERELPSSPLLRAGLEGLRRNILTLNSQ